MSSWFDKYKEKIGGSTNNINENTKNNNNSNNTNSNSSNSNNYYQMARDQEYSALLDKEIELETAKQNAIKYTNNQLASRGYDSQGYGSSMNSGIYNQYMNALGSAKRDYQSNMNNINYQEQLDNDSKNNEKFGSIISMMEQGAGNQDLVNKMLEDYQLGTIDDKGNFIFGEKPEGMSDDVWAQIKYAYNIQQDALQTQQNATSTFYKNKDDFINTASFTKKDGTSGLISENFKYETKALLENYENGTYADGTVIMLQNGSHEIVYVKVDNGGLRLSNQQEYNQATNQGNSAYLIWKVNVKK